MIRRICSVLVFFTVIFCNRSYAQIDSTAILYSAKLQIVSEGYRGDSVGWDFYLNKYQVRFLNSKGFGDLQFVLIEEKRKDSVIGGRSKLYEENNLFFICNYIVAYNHRLRLFYKLKGFITNEVNSFVGALKEYDPGLIGTQFFCSDEALASLSLSKKLCYVEFLDIDCLRKAYNSKSVSKGSEIFTCLKSCYWRDWNAYSR